MAAWLASIWFFWTLTPVYLGGWPLEFEGGGGVSQMGGLLLSFIAYLAVWAGFRALLSTFVNPILAVALAIVAATILLPLLTRLCFRVFGVRITKA